MDALLLFNDDDFRHVPVGPVQFTSLRQSDWGTHPAQMASVYQLLCGAHYRTSPLDLRRMMDAPGQQIIAGLAAEKPAAALWLLEEGGLSPALSQAVWAGFRRPRGNLVAQSLAAHGGNPLAATYNGLRISRIAVHPARQREGLGQALIAWARQHCARAVDYLSVSFGYTPELWRFWAHCGFTLVRIGSHREASSGCYNAIALLALTPAGETLVGRERLRFARDVPFLQAWIAEKLPVAGVMASTLNEEGSPALPFFMRKDFLCDASLKADFALRRIARLGRSILVMRSGEIIILDRPLFLTGFLWIKNWALPH